MKKFVEGDSLTLEDVKQALKEAHNKKKAILPNSVSMGSKRTPTKASQEYGNANVQINRDKAIDNLKRLAVNYVGVNDISGFLPMLIRKKLSLI